MIVSRSADTQSFSPKRQSAYTTMIDEMKGQINYGSVDIHIKSVQLMGIESSNFDASHANGP
jgi:hypothetical protein